MIIDALAGYAFARLRFPSRDLLFALVVASLIVPGEILLIPRLIIIWQLGWLNTFNALILPPVAGGFGVFLLRQFFLASHASSRTPRGSMAVVVSRSCG